MNRDGNQPPNEWFSLENTNLFSQIDAMIAAVQSESTALDNMRDKVKELDGMKQQINMLSRKLNKSEQASLTLKATIMNLHEQLNELKNQKAEIEKGIHPLKQEAERMKEACIKENNMRCTLQEEYNRAQKEIEIYKSYIHKYEVKLSENQNNSQMMSSLQQQNVLLQRELQACKQRYNSIYHDHRSKVSLLQQTQQKNTQYGSICSYNSYKYDDTYYL